MITLAQRRLLERLFAATARPDPDASDDFLVVHEGDRSLLQHPGFPNGVEPIELSDLLELAKEGAVTLDDPSSPHFVRLVSPAWAPLTGRRRMERPGPLAAPARRDIDAFLSHAGEDSATARDIALGLRRAGFGIWFDRFELRVGDRILDRIKEGLAQAGYGILLVSEPFLEKHWPRFEMTVLQEAAIEGEKRLLPVWHHITKEQIARHDPTLAGIYALSTSDGIDNVVRALAQAMVGPGQTVAVVPGWESPMHRFLQGVAELTVGLDGPAFNLWEALLHIPDGSYPLFVEGQTYSKEELVTSAMLSLGGPGEEIARLTVGGDGLMKIDALIRAAGGDPELFRS